MKEENKRVKQVMEGNWSCWEVGLYFSLMVSRDIQCDIHKKRACLSLLVCMKLYHVKTMAEVLPITMGVCVKLL